jgi:hypothetical protein
VSNKFVRASTRNAASWSSVILKEHNQVIVSLLINSSGSPPPLLFHKKEHNQEKTTGNAIKIYEYIKIYIKMLTIFF